MDAPNSLLEERLRNPVRAGLTSTGLYHSFRLPNGTVLTGVMTLDFLERRVESFQLPAYLHGKRVLDIGPWDGYMTFEMERRGAEMVAIDYVDLDTFRALHRAFNSRATYKQLDVYELDANQVGYFDIVLCLAVLYHLKHPLLALEKICAVTTDVCILETFVIDGEEWLQGRNPPLPYAEFYEYGELAGQLDNWCGPTVEAVAAWIRAAGFASAEVLKVTNKAACFAAHRKWEDLPEDRDPSIRVLGLSSHSNKGRSFHSNKEEYIQLYCDWKNAETPPLDSVFPEVDGFGVAPLWCSLTADVLLVSFRLPPGLAPGRHETRVKIGHTGWSEVSEFYVDLQPVMDTIVLVSAQDGVTWETGKVNWSDGGCMTLWMEGLSHEAASGNVTVVIAGIPHYPDAVESKSGQVNVRLRPSIGPGTHLLTVVHRGANSNSMTVEVLGTPPKIKGLECLG